MGQPSKATWAAPSAQPSPKYVRSFQPRIQKTTLTPSQELISELGASKVAVQGVDYEATVESNALLGSGGGPVMAQLAQQAIKNCPNTKIAISGYSQGGEVVHYAVQQAGLSPSIVSSAVIYGDPEDGTPVGSLPASKLKEFCVWIPYF